MFYKNQDKKVKYQLLTNPHDLQNTEAATATYSMKIALH